MKDGFVPVAAVSPAIRVADIEHNVAACEDVILTAAEEGARVIVLPELCLTGATAGDLFFQTALLEAAEAGIVSLADTCAEIDALVVVGAPLRVAGKLYDCAFVLCAGKLLGVVPKVAVPAVGDGGTLRHFSPGTSDCVPINVADFQDVPFGASQLFACEDLPELLVGVEVGEDLIAPFQPSQDHVLAGATLICNPSASAEIVGKADKRLAAVVSQSARLECAYIQAEAGEGESSTDAVYAGHNLICEMGHVLAEALPFSGRAAASEIDVDAIVAERRRISTFAATPVPEMGGYTVTAFHLDPGETRLTRHFDAYPFVPDDELEREDRCETILAIQAAGLARRLQHTGSKRAVLGVSGGLDSTLAMLVTARAFDLLGLERAGILAITMPGFGTTQRTKGNAAYLAEALGAELQEIDITASVRQHFYDIQHSEEDHNATYENAQARERTQVLMDIANDVGGFVVGTGDLSELALGWATYNGDHMSMYGVNADVPKTLVRHLVRYVADTCGDEDLSRVLYDVLDTPVSPELLPAEDDGSIAQQTESIVGPYELHDFFLHAMLRRGFSPRKIYRIACAAFDGSHGGPAYDPETILAWMKVFYRRFFAQQFKRSCLPDGPKVGSVGVSPRGGLAMPSDASRTVWETELEAIG